MTRPRAAAFALALVLSACSRDARPPAAPPAPEGPPRAQVMVLGVYHFDNPNLDYVKTDVDDHLSPRRQAEIAEVVRRLAAFGPTRIAVEERDDERLNARYAAFRAGERQLGADETDQLALRLAAELGHERLHAVDHAHDMDFERLMGAAQRSGDRVFLERFQQVIAEVKAEQARQREQTVLETLVALNDPRRIARDRDAYLAMARVRAGDDFAGADVLAGWYQRNFRIFASLAATVTSPEDRVLVIFGSSHSAILRELVAASPDLRLVEPNDVLAP
jgi:hypothetical protein